jgi:serine-type D-Ala-D-Ala carboxypeptidase (penicillin-binding protein 5/6)
VKNVQKYIAIYSFLAIGTFLAGSYAADKGLFASTVGEKAKNLTAQVQGVFQKNTPPTEPKGPFIKPIGSVGSIQARAAIAFDITNGVVLFEKNASDKMPLASITKLMTGLITAEHVKPDETISIPRAALNSYGDSSLFSGEEWRAQDIVDFMLMTSSNDAASALALHVGQQLALENNDPRTTFISLMNKRADALQMHHSEFFDESGLDADITTPGAYGSAQDVATLLSYIARRKPELIEATIRPVSTFTSLSGVAHAARNTNESIPSIPALIGGKTGYTDLAGGNLAILFDRSINEPVAVVVLGSTKEARFSDIETIVKALQ